MSIWLQSEQPGSKPAALPSVDTYLPDNRPADGTQTTVTNQKENPTVESRIVIKDNKILWVADDGTITASFSIVPEVSATIPVQVIAKPGKDVYLDVLGIPRPTL